MQNVFPKLIVYVGLALLLAAIVTGLVYFAYMRFANPASSLDLSDLPPQFTYEDCLLRQGSSVRGEFNEICTTVEGKIFIADVQNTGASRDKIQECPTKWVVETGSTQIIDDSEGVTNYPVRKEYMVFEGKVVDVREIDREWVVTNCGVSIEATALQFTGQ